MCSTLSDKWYKDDEIEICGQKVKLNRKIIEVDITPNCDYAQNKNHMLRTIFGYIIEIGQVTVEGSNKWLDYKYSEKIKHKIQYDYIYVTPELQFKNKLCVLVLNTKYITIENIFVGLFINVILMILAVLFIIPWWLALVIYLIEVVVVLFNTHRIIDMK